MDLFDVRCVRDVRKGDARDSLEDVGTEGGWVR